MNDYVKRPLTLLVALLGTGCTGSDQSHGQRPLAPTGLAATGGLAAAMVSWAAPENALDAEVTGYTVTALLDSSEGPSLAVAGIQAEVQGLLDGTEYRFVVVAHGANGDSDPSEASNVIVTFAVPLPPASVDSLRGNESALVVWASPDGDGGTPVLDYTITTLPDATTSVALGTSLVISNLTNGTEYAFAVAARNAVGLSSVATTEAVTPATIPDAPAMVLASSGNAAALVTWTVPSSDGGSPIIDFDVTALPDGFGAVAVGTSLVFSGLTNGVEYSFSVAARNDVGLSEPSAPSNLVIPATVPGAPTMVAAVGGNELATVSWVAPVSDGGRPILSFTITPFDGGTAGVPVTVGPDETMTVVTGLTNGVAYTFRVAASNLVGDSATATSNLVTPATVPAAPMSVGITKRPSVLHWIAPSNGGSPILDFVVTPFLAGNTAGTPSIVGAGATSLDLEVEDHTPYRFEVVARNAIGAGLAGSSAIVSLPCYPCGFPGPTSVAAEIPYQWPTRVVIGDIDGDGLPDLITANQLSQRVSARLGRGDGAFDLLPGTATSGAPISLAAGDVNGDDIDDVVWSSNGNSLVRVLLGSVTGSFVNGGSFSLPFGAESLGLVDLDGDLDLDIAAVAGTSRLTVLLGDGAGAFLLLVSYPNILGTSPADMVIADFDDDGFLDIATANRTGDNLSVAFGDGDGTFDTFGASTPVGDGAESVAAGDFNNDGFLDFVTANEAADTISVILATGAHTLGPATSVPAQNSPRAVSVGDFDADGNADIAVAAAPRYGIAVRILLGIGDGTFAPGVTYGVDDSNVPTVGDVDMTVGDLNLDGALDLAISNLERDQVGVLLGRGDGTFRGGFSLPAGSHAHAVASADFDEDGHADLLAVGDPDHITAGDPGNARVFIGDGTGGFSVGGDSPVAISPTTIVIEDFDSDDNLDVAVAGQGGQWVSILLGDGLGSFAPEIPVSVGGNPTPLVSADFNEDGIPDLLVTTIFPIPMTLQLLLGVGDGTFTSGLSLTDIDWPLIAEDFDNDGNMDFLTTNSADTSLRLFFGDGTGSFVEMTSSIVATHSPMGAGDLNSDGIADLLVYSPVNGNPYDLMAVRLGFGDGTFGPELSFSSEIRAGGHFQGFVDLDGDQILDLVLMDLDRELIRFFPGVGDGSFLPSREYLAGQNPDPFGSAIADFNEDGRLDIATPNFFVRTVTVLLQEPL